MDGLSCQAILQQQKENGHMLIVVPISKTTNIIYHRSSWIFIDHQHHHQHHPNQPSKRAVVLECHSWFNWLRRSKSIPGSHRTFGNHHWSGNLRGENYENLQKFHHHMGSTIIEVDYLTSNHSAKHQYWLRISNTKIEQTAINPYKPPILILSHNSHHNKFLLISNSLYLHYKSFGGTRSWPTKSQG